MQAHHKENAGGTPAPHEPLAEFMMAQGGPEPLVDIHCHLLPGLDDGAGSWKDALAMARAAANEGIATIVTTPHQLGSYARNRGEEIREHVRELQQRLDEEDIPLEVLPGADVRIEPDMLKKLRSREVLTLADRGRHVLLELPHEVYLPLDRILADLRGAGMVGILSHPERNLGILGQPSVLWPLVEECGCLLQVTAGSLLGLFGGRIRAMAESLIKQGLTHFVATDAHNVTTRPVNLNAAFQRVAQLAGRQAAIDLCCRNPAAVAAGQKVEPGCRKVEARGWGRWLPWKKAG
jgi:protein-tyrosine phosphatase